MHLWHGTCLKIGKLAKSYRKFLNVDMFTDKSGVLDQICISIVESVPGNQKVTTIAAMNELVGVLIRRIIWIFFLFTTTRQRVTDPRHPMHRWHGTCFRLSGFGFRVESWGLRVEG